MTFTIVKRSSDQLMVLGILQETLLVLGRSHGDPGRMSFRVTIL